MATVEQPRDKFLVVDASNVAYDPSGKASLDRLSLVKRALMDAGFSEFVFIADASLRHRFSEPEALLFEEMIKAKEVFQAPANSSADEFIIDLAKRKNGFVLSNDLFRRHLGRWRALPSRRVTYLIVDDEVLFPGIEPAEEAALEAEVVEPRRSVLQRVAEERRIVVGGLLRRSPFFDLAVGIPLVSALGGLAAAAAWIFCLGVVFAPVSIMGTSTLAYVLTGVAAVVLFPLAIFITGAITAAFFTGEQLAASERELRGWTVMSIALWITGAAVFFVALRYQVSGLTTLGLILVIGPAFPLMGFIRSARRFQPFITWVDHVLVVVVCLLAGAWIVGEALAVYFVATSDLQVHDKVLLILILALLAVQAGLVLARWAMPAAPPRLRPLRGEVVSPGGSGVR